MKHVVIVCAAVLSTALSACSGDDFEAQAENAFRQQFLEELKGFEALAGARFQDHGVTSMDVENFRTSDCKDQGSQRTCNVSFQTAVVVNGEKEVTEPDEGRVVFEKRDGQWLIVSID